MHVQSEAAKRQQQLEKLRMTYAKAQGKLTNLPPVPSTSAYPRALPGGGSRIEGHTRERTGSLGSVRSEKSEKESVSSGEAGQSIANNGSASNNAQAVR